MVNSSIAKLLNCVNIWQININDFVISAINKPTASACYERDVLKRQRTKTESLLHSPLAILMLTLIWALLCATSYYLNNKGIVSAAQTAMSMRGDIGNNTAQAIIKWSTGHDRIYIPQTKDNQPNPYIDHAEKNIVTPTGTKLTLITPGRLLQQVTQYLNDKTVKYGVISLQAMNPSTKPTAWQASILRQFLQDPSSKSFTTTQDNRFHYITPILAEKNCISCHHKLDLKVGDLMGAVTFSYDLTNINTQKGNLQQQNILSHLLAFSLLMLVSLLALRYARRLIVNIETEKKQREQIISDKTAVLREEIKQHKIARAELQRLATHDPLTGIRNRRHFLDCLDAEIQRFQRYSNDFSLLMLDLDHFKKINDRYGHDCGDTVLIKFAKEIKQLLRKSDVFVRYGGEEFAIIATSTRIDSAKRFADKLTRQVAAMSIDYNEHAVGITVSIGVAAPSLLPQPSPELLIATADKALYQAKNSGRNQAVCASSFTNLQQGK